MDKITKAQRSYNMSRVRGSNTVPELKIRRLLKILGFTYQPKGIYGKPDFANKNEHIAIFVDGCFWHGCSSHYRPPKSSRAFWVNKIARNMKRDKEVMVKLKHDGWKVIRVWEHDVDKLRDLKV